jgi:6-phosphogluconate dehydrogenase
MAAIPATTTTSVARASSASAVSITSTSARAGAYSGLERGYCLMIGGEAEIVRRLEPIFATLAPSADSALRTSGREGKPQGGELGFLHCGPHGAGHFVKMVHNGIEYGLMAAYAEGFNILRHADDGTVTATTPKQRRRPSSTRSTINTSST